MKLDRLMRLATVSAVALGIAAYAGPTWAFEMDDDTEPVDVTADVDNTVTFAVTDIDFGVIGVTSDAVDIATLVMQPGGAIADDIGAGIGGAGEAHIVSETNSGTPADADLTVALANSQVFVYYSGLSDLSDGSAPNLVLEQVADNLPTPGSFTATGAVQVVGIGSTDGAGALSWNIGASISTAPTAAPYETNTYTGNFDIILTY